MSELQQTYRGHTIRLEPFEKRCSNFRAVVSDPEGNDIKHITMAGKTEDVAFAQARMQIDFEFDLVDEREQRARKRRELGLEP